MWRMKTGRKPLYTDPTIVAKLIDRYFDSLKGVQGAPDKPPTMAGLALALKMHRDTLHDYSRKPLFSDTIKQARLRIEAYWESNLATSGCSGSIFWLKNNAQYRDKIETDHTSSDGSMSPKQSVDPALSKAIIDALDKTI